MRNYLIRFSDYAHEDLENILTHLSGFYPSTPKKFRLALNKRMNVLKYSPFIGAVYRYNKNYRYVIVNDYLVFYIADEKEHTVEISRVFHSSEDINKKLHQTS